MSVERSWDKERADRAVKWIILKIYSEFVRPNRARNYTAWEAGMSVMNSIPTK